MKGMYALTRWALAGIVLTCASAQTPLFPLKDIRPGMQATAKTVFAGDRIEDFQIEILGVLENAGPRRSVILGKLSGGPIARTGVLQGMSGSPVYIGGRLAGALAMAFPFAKEPIAGIRPIEEMLAEDGPPARAAGRVHVDPDNLLAGLPRRELVQLGAAQLSPIVTPLWLSGFTQNTVGRFRDQLRALGFEPIQGVSGGAAASQAMGPPGRLQPGSMISIQLVRGDLSVGADGTVTHIAGNRMYAFGHRFLALGEAEMPFTRAEVLTVLPSLNTSFKISAARELMGVISHDSDTAVRGELGRRAALVPVKLAVRGAGKQTDYRMELVNDRFLTPFLLQLVTFSALDATERMAGAGTIALRGQIRFAGQPEPLRLHNAYTADTTAAAQAALGAALPLAYALQSSFARLRPEAVELDLEVRNEKRQAVLVDAYPSRRTVRPGEEIELFVVLRAGDGADEIRKASYRVPPGAAPGTLNFTVVDALSANLLEIRRLLNTPRSPGQLIATLNTLRPSTKTFVRVWRQEPTFTVDGADLSDPPASVAMILGRTQTLPGTQAPSQGARLAELEIDSGGWVVSGSRTAQVEIKE